MLLYNLINWSFENREAPLPFKSQGINFTTTKASSKIVVEKQDIVTSKMVSPSSRSNMSSSNLSNQAFPSLGGEGTPKSSQAPQAGGDVTPKSNQGAAPTTPGVEKMDASPTAENDPPSTPNKVINVSTYLLKLTDKDQFTQQLSCIYNKNKIEQCYYTLTF